MSTELEYKSVNKLFEKSFREHWERNALSNYQGRTLTYQDVAERIAMLHICFEQCGLKKGDKVVTIGGLHGIIRDIKDDTIILEVTDGVRITVNKSSISM